MKLNYLSINQFMLSLIYYFPFPAQVAKALAILKTDSESNGEVGLFVNIFTSD